MTLTHDDGSVLKLERTPTGWAWTLLLPERAAITGVAATFLAAREAARNARIADHVRAWEAR